jgi:SAM-dependent methyltransferase
MSSRNAESISFDRAADFYDRTRAFTPEAQTAVTEMLVGELQARRTLEIGVGTGRIAIPLHERGIELVGLDLSFPMMRKLVEHMGPHVFPLVQGDATKIPLRDGCVDAVIASWVLHLVTDWSAVLHEIRRVICDGAVVLITEPGHVGQSGDTGDLNLQEVVTRRFRAAAGITGWPRGPKTQAELDVEMTRLGGTPRALPPIPESRTATIEAFITAFEAGIFSVSWGLTEEERRAACDEVRVWARSEFGDLDVPRAIQTPHVWRAYDFPAAGSTS